MKNVLTIAGSDVLGGGGIQADLKTFEELDTFGISVITCIATMTNENNFSVHNLSQDLIEQQINSVIENMNFDTVKLGLINDERILNYVANFLQTNSFKVILDPILIFKESSESLSTEYLQILKNKILPLSTVITPNLAEAELLSGITRIQTIEDMSLAAHKIQELGVPNVIIKGGTRFAGQQAIDYALLEDTDFILKNNKIDSRNTDGAGCTFSAVMAAELAKGTSLKDAIYLAKGFVLAGIKSGIPLDNNLGNVWQGAYRHQNKSEVI